MVKLVPELIQQSLQYINPVKDRELVLRGYKIPVIENMGATLDQFDTIDLSDNDIRKLDGFPLLKRLKHILLNNNKVVRIGEDLAECLPNLESICLTNNVIQELGDLDPLSQLKKLELVSFLGNPVISKQHYRLYLIHKVPQLRIIDFRRVRLREREQAKQVFKGKGSKELQKEIKKTKTFVPGAQIMAEGSKPTSGLSTKEQASIRRSIANARSMEEIERLQHLLRTGNIPGKKRQLDEED